jgi:hypothetical protein
MAGLQFLSRQNDRWDTKCKTLKTVGLIISFTNTACRSLGRYSSLADSDHGVKLTPHVVLGTVSIFASDKRFSPLLHARGSERRVNSKAGSLKHRLPNHTWRSFPSLSARISFFKHQIINVTITILDIIHRPFFYVKTQRFGDWVLSPSSLCPRIYWAHLSRFHLKRDIIQSPKHSVLN